MISKFTTSPQHHINVRKTSGMLNDQDLQGHVLSVSAPNERGINVELNMLGALSGIYVLSVSCTNASLTNWNILPYYQGCRGNGNGNHIYLMGIPIVNPVRIPMGNPVGNLMGNPMRNPMGNPVGVPMAILWEILRKSCGKSYGKSCGKYYGNPVRNPVGVPMAILWEILWEFPQKSLGMGWEWELKFHSHCTLLTIFTTIWIFQ